MCVVNLSHCLSKLDVKRLLSNQEVIMSEKITRREVIKRAAYMAPVILTLSAVPAFAKGGSGGEDKNKDKEDENKDKKEK